MKKALFAIAAVLFLTAPGFNQTSSEAVYSTKAGAISGYDPVAYFSEGRAVKGLPEFTYEWNGAVWHFASTANRDTFQQNPEKYAPQYGGWCAYGWAQGYPAKADPDAWTIVDDKLFLNYNQKVLGLWKENQAEYILKANEYYTAEQGKN